MFFSVMSLIYARDKVEMILKQGKRIIKNIGYVRKFG